MKNHIFGFIFVGILLLSSCSEKDANNAIASGEKSPFYIDVYSLGTDSMQSEIEKSGRITARSTLTLSSKGVGEIAKIEVKEGSQVKAGSVIARLKDTLTNYDLQLAQAENALKIQNASRETTSINLDSGVENARIAYERAKQAYETLTGKNALQYDSVVSSNEKTLKGYNEIFRNYLSDAEKNMTSLIYDGDKILGISTNFEYTNDGWEPYLGVRVGDSRAAAVNEWNRLYTLRAELRARIEKNKTIDLSNPQADFELVAKSYLQTRIFADAMLYMIQNNIVGAGLPQAMQDGWVLTWNGYRSQIGASESSFNSWKAQTVNFFDSYKDTELATRLALISLSRPLKADEVAQLNAGGSDLKLTYETTRLSLADSIRNAELSLQQAKSAYENAEALKNSTIAQLDGSKKSAEISLELARRNADNLLVRAPVSGTISKVLTSVGQSVATGAPVAEFTSNEPEMVLDIESNLARTLSIGEEVEVSVEGKLYKGTIIALSSVAGKNLLSTIRVSVTDGSSAIGKTATITFYPKESIDGDGLTSLPLESVRIIAENEGEIRYLSGESIATKNIKISAIRSGFVETADSIESTMQIILSDTTNYDTTKHKLTIQKN